MQLWSRVVVGASLAALGAAGCGAGSRSLTAANAACRTWMRRFVSSSGTAYECTAGSPTLSCSAIQGSQTWTYASVTDFVREAAVPNRILTVRRETSACATFAYQGCSQILTAYTHDGRGRVVRRERSSSNTLSSPRTSDITTYVAWDEHGRPTHGEVAADDLRESIDISYDDGAGLMEVSNGELTEQDGRGNTVRELIKYGVGPGTLWERRYIIQSFQEVCEP
jgi:hypothetical protein